MKCGAAERIVDRPKSATMGIDDGPADGQPQTEAVGLGGKEGVEDLIEPRPGPDAASTYRDAEDLAWSRRWPSECIWRARKA